MHRTNIIISFFLHTPCTILSIPIINRLTDNRNIDNTIPDTGCAKTTKDTTNDNMPTPMRYSLDHFDTFLFVIPCIILAIPSTNNPAASKVTKISVIDNGNARTENPNPIAIIPNITLLVCEDLFIFGSAPAAILSAPAANNVIESRRTMIAMPDPELKIIVRDKPITIIPKAVSAILNAFKFF